MFVGLSLFGTKIDAATNVLSAIDWIVKHQLSRRNLNRLQMSYYRGLQYEREKGKHGGDRKSSRHYDDLKTGDKLAQQHKVSMRTIDRDAQFARAIDTVGEIAGSDAKIYLLSYDNNLARLDIVNLGEIAAASNSQTIKNLLTKIKCFEASKDISQLIGEVHKQIKSVSKEPPDNKKY